MVSVSGGKKYDGGGFGYLWRRKADASYTAGAAAGNIHSVSDSCDVVSDDYRGLCFELCGAVSARKEEVHHAQEEGIEFLVLNNPVKIVGDENGHVKGMECIKMELGEPDASGRRRPIPIEGSNFILDVDTAIMSIGTSPNPLIRSTTPGLETNDHGCLIVDENESTTKEGVYAGGDAVTGAATVILAMGAGKKAAAAIDEYIKNKK